MSETEEKLIVWTNELQQYRLPRWEELPDIELYMDQVITLIERYLSPLVGQSDNKVITPAMITTMSNWVLCQSRTKNATKESIWPI